MYQPQAGPPRVAFDSQQISQGIEALARGILARHPDPRGLGLVGVHSGGDLLVRRVEAALARQGGQAGLTLDKGLVDMSFYRDDWSRLDQMPSLRNTDVPFPVEGRELVLVDDVIFTGRTVRASLDAIFSLGRPARVELAVLVDRGHREFPIEPDYVGLILPTQRHQSVNVFLHDDPAQDRVTLEDHKYQVGAPARAVG
ncbi:MAG: bifunctional pyr operon transcriptional regulator/uracil phosphoribosyltransferase PyrR [Desulfarculus sp.]|nr:bifunctional pyr operon transcriptional regulator/uracil phosphoribosyltransferase PyrR [Desulfarculus sp.]